jgi:hypothetical protein
MNVMNRKMFTNRDARRKLANMGGIIASSPELLGTAQSFAPGGQTNVEQYVAYIPGINGGRPVRLTAETLSRLQSLAPDLMQQSIVLDEATATEQGLDVMRLRPGDAFVERQLTEKQAPPPSVQDSVTQPSIRDIVREGLASTYSKSPMEAIAENLTTDSENPMIKLIESGLTAAGVKDPNARLLPPSNDDRPFAKKVGEALRSSLQPVGQTLRDAGQPIGETLREAGQPIGNEIRAGLASSYSARPDLSKLVTPDEENPMVQLIQSGIASLQTEDGSPIDAQYPELSIRGGDTDASRRVAEIIAERRTDLPGVNLPGPSTTYEIDPNAAIKAGQSLSVADQMLGLGFTGGDIDPSALTSESDMGLTSITGGDGEEYFVSPAGSVFKKENGQLKSVSGGEAMRVVDIAQRQGKDFSKSPVGELPLGSRDVDPRTGMVIPDTFEKLSIPIGGLRTPEMITDIFSGDKDKETLDEQVETAQKAPTEEQLPTKEETAEEIDTASEDTSNEVQQGDRGFTPSNTQQQINTVEKKVKEEIEKPDGGNANAVASSGLLQAAGVDTSNMGLKERVQSMQEMMAELVGYDDDDEKKEFWLTMAGIGFQIASGQSSKALVNIAEGLAQGAKKFAENQATRQAREDKLALTALGEVLADDRATRKFGRDLQLAGIRASGSSSYSTVDRMFKSVLDSSLAGYKAQVEDGTMTNEQAVSRAMADASTAFPGSQFANTTNLPPEETVQVIQNGETITVPVSKIPTQKKVLTEEG